MLRFLLKNIIQILFVINFVLAIVFFFLHGFPTILMVLHIITVTLLWLLVAAKIKVVELSRHHWRDCILAGVLLTLSLGVGLYKISEITPGIYGDEVTVGRKSLELLAKPGLPPFDGVYSHPTPLMYMTAGSIQVLGRTKLALRLPSVVFAALAVVAFYILLRLFFPFKVAVAGAMLLVFQYTAVVLSRLAYEPSASMFFQLVTLIFLSLYYKLKKKIYLIGIALSLGAGLYTYLNFRAFAVVVFVVTLILIGTFYKNNFKQDLFLFLATLFIAVMPLVSYSLIDPHGFWLRSNEISIFSRHYTTIEFIKELGGNAFRIALFPAIGDPNAGKNPSNVPLVDALTTAISIIGFVYLYKKQRLVFWMLLLLFLPPFISDVFSTEVIPEFHYYGLGHPNALRVSGFIPVVLFATTAGLMWAYDKWHKKKSLEINVALGTTAVLICLLNFILYFNQKTIDPVFFDYNYDVNHQDYMDLIEYVKQSPAQKISMTRPIAEFEHVPFFLHGLKRVDSFDLASTVSAQKVIDQSDLTAIDVTDNTIDVLNTLANVYAPPSMNTKVIIIQDPVEKSPKIAIFEKMNKI